jgi:outer membrane receptor for ferrienterochelin and colicins
MANIFRFTPARPCPPRFTRACFCAVLAAALEGGGARAQTEAGVDRAANAPAQRLERMVVTGTLTERPIFDSPVRTQLILSQSIIASGARNLGDAIQLLPGVRTETDCQNCNESNIRLCGLERGYVAVLFDGQPLLSSLASVYGVDQIPAQIYDRIEVVKGGASALYGAGAVGGVINIIPRIPARTGGSFAYTLESTRGRPTTQVSAGYDYVSPDKRTALTTFADYQRVTPVDVDGDGYTELSKRQLEVAGFRFTQAFKVGKLTADYTHAYEYRRGGNNLSVPDHLANIAETLSTRRDFGGLAWVAKPTSDFDWRISGFVAYTNRHSYYGGLGDPTVPGYDPVQARADALTYYGHTTNPAGYLNGQANWTCGAHVVTTGFQLRRERINDQTANPLFERLDDTFSTVGVFLQDDWKFAPAWEVVYGARLDKSSVLSQASVSPRAAVKYAPSDEFVMRGTVSTGYRPPEIFAEDLHSENVGGSPVQTRNAPGLAKEDSFSTTLGADWVPSFGRGKLRLEAVGFFTRLTHSFATDRIELAPGNFVNLRTNTAGSKVYGVEVNSVYEFTKMTRLDVGLVRQASPFDEAQPDFGNKDRLKTPKLDGVAQFNTKIEDFADLFIAAKYTGPMLVGRRPDVYDPNFNEIRRTPAFLVFDTSLAKTFDLSAFNKLTLTVGVKNLTNAYQKDIERGPSRDNDYVYGPRLPRTYFMGLRMSF